jgi:hypothetical protein
MPHTPPNELVIAVYVENGTVHTLPEYGFVEHQGQEVCWIACGGEISDIRFRPSGGKTPPPIQPRRRIHRTRFAPGLEGRYKYSFKFHPDGGGNAEEVDPHIIIEY